MAKTTPAIILSAGYSKRLGEHKALVEVAGKTLLELAVLKLQQAGCAPVIIVVNQELQFDALMLSNGAVVVVNKLPENGRTGSLKVGLTSVLAELGRMPNKAIMCPVDRPGWKASHIAKLIESDMSCCLTDGSVKGHPVSLVKNDLLNIMAANDDATLKNIVRFESVAVDNSLLSLNIDTPKDKVRLTESADFFVEL
ncbi:MAG: NTP transferase domain-containing protein [Candidatus Poseidoniaceae archaeon]|nr:NTP transferase domain-containing protein [Candidatus Poseidoniaceae archaeon]